MEFCCMSTHPQLADLCTIRDVAQDLGISHSAAYSLACAGLLGDRVIVGRTHLYDRATVRAAISIRRKQVRRGGARAPLVGTL